MSLPAWGDLEALFNEALEHPPADRAAFLTERCVGRPNLQAELEALLRAHDQGAGELEVPPVSPQEGLKTGDRLGPYEVLTELGAGGMGKVYRARDTKLNRDVALKILPESFALDPDRRARFKREAHVLASLNHPNIAAIYGFEESDGVQALVLELVEGPTLADRIANGPIPLDEALPIARQIADALEAAHEQGIVHRDLKPANIKLRSDGTVKVLDFGLAKALDSAPVAIDASQSPTVTSPAMMTGVGVLMGTAAYMSPEQARGRSVDKRSDIWAFGCVLYEMLTARRAFAGDEVTDTLARIITTEPDWTSLPTETPVAIRRLLRRCLQKERKGRLDSAVAARLEIDEALTAPAADSSPVVPPARRRERLAWTTAAVATVALIGTSTFLFVRARPEPVLVSRFAVTLPEGQRLAGLGQTAIAFSPDGRRLVYVANSSGSQGLYLREIDSLAGKFIPGTEDGAYPFFSPDGQSIGFFASDWLKKISLGGGPPVTLARVEDRKGGSWGSDGNIVFASGSASGLSIVPAAGGTVQTLTNLNRQKAEASHRFPHHFPGGRALLFTVGTGGSWDEARIEVLNLGTGERKLLLEGGSDARYVSTGHLVFVRSGTLMAVDFDLERLEVKGSPVLLVEGMLGSSTNSGAAQATFSDAGSLAYVSGDARAFENTVVWVDRQGIEQPIQLPPRGYSHPRLSPDGQRVALTIDEGNKQDVWIYDLRRGTTDRQTLEGVSGYPFWTPDGKKVTFQSSKAGSHLFWKPVGSGGGAERLTPGENAQLSGSWSPDGETLAFADVDPGTGLDIWTLSLKNGRKAAPLLRTSFNEADPALSPDGRWIAYESNESGHNEVYVADFPGMNRKELVSTDGGAEAVWSRNGRELFYRSGDKMMAVAIMTQPAFRASTPKFLFEKPHVPFAPLRNYDVASDGSRFLMLKDSEQLSSATHVNVVLSWTEELKRRVPTK
jgi:eukaryotic-like serine/threonine-protein kinase